MAVAPCVPVTLPESDPVKLVALVAVNALVAVVALPERLPEKVPEVVPAKVRPEASFALVTAPTAMLVAP